ncbi:MAG: hypothetical protein AW07_01745 [Candidatus Accumulibacter sp. SK-11]|nr:MAG: hypothetical protein AW07_01745 [Candidatus Accumulibacter sp. SK-11]
MCAPLAAATAVSGIVTRLRALTVDRLRDPGHFCRADSSRSQSQGKFIPRVH